MVICVGIDCVPFPKGSWRYFLLNISIKNIHISIVAVFSTLSPFMCAFYMCRTHPIRDFKGEQRINKYSKNIVEIHKRFKTTKSRSSRPSFNYNQARTVKNGIFLYFYYLWEFLEIPKIQLLSQIYPFPLKDEYSCWYRVGGGRYIILCGASVRFNRKLVCSILLFDRIN